jgi:hypothetical protein
MNPPKRRAPLNVYVSDHARDRARKRFSGFKAARIIDEVHEGLVAGRFSARRPTWCAGEETGLAIYVWTADHARVYVLGSDNRRLPDSFVVVTTLYGVRLVEVGAA